MAKDLNKVMIIGRLGKDPEMRYTPGGSPVTTFSVAAGRQWKDGSGDLHEETEWFNVVTWNKLAEICNEHLHKASRVYIEGRLQTRQWQDQEGAAHYRTEVIASDMIMLDSRAPRDHGHFDDHDPRDQRGARPQRGPAQPPEINDEDIPF
ncbi:MAG TPA: single-stranded DNA-binding protein [Roseiflexaceae bacterium]|nr:single-stranded DNA-binding protein [Roseiflexaceae bacterium]HMP40822.1 single-stranded DNA-binding protein [Roseiflexaceae bacterium]